MKVSTLSLPALALGALALSLLPGLETHAATKKFTKTAAYCEGTQPNGNPNPCGGLGYVNAGGYTVTCTKVESTENPYDNNQACDGISFKMDNNLDIGHYGEYVLPAPCRYSFTMQIDGGDQKGKHLYLTPGCAFAIESKGTTNNDNKPRKRSIKWSDKAKESFAAQGITVTNDDVSDVYWHMAQGQQEKHLCQGD